MLVPASTDPSPGDADATDPRGDVAPRAAAGRGGGDGHDARRAETRAAAREDARLIERCRRGDADAWNEIVARHARLVVSIPRRHGLSEADADDVAQGVFLQLFRRLETLGDGERLAAWLMTTAHRETWRVGRRRGRDAAFEARFDDLSEPDPDDAARWERSHLVRRALEELGGRCEPLLRALFEEGGGDYHAISASLGMPVGSIGPTRARCFAKLETILERLGVDAGELDD